MREGPLRFRVGAAFRLIPILPERTTDDDATTTTRDAKPVPYATAHPAQRVRRVGDGRGGAVVLGSRCFLHFSASLFPFFLISVPFCIFPVRDFISHFSCPRFHFAFLLHIGPILRSQLLERGGTGAITLPFR